MSDHAAIAERLRKAALAYPEAYEETPWGERVAKVKGKIFLFAGTGKNGALSLSVKLPTSARAALDFPFASPTAYGLGKSGWVSARFEPGAQVPEGLLLEWLDESYRALAPKKLVKLLDDPASARAKTTEKPTKSATSASKSGSKKSKKSPGKARVLVVGDDRLRNERAVSGLAAEELPALALEPGAEVLGRAHELRPAAVVFDLGRRQPVALELASALEAEKIAGTAIVLAGARDAAAVRAAKKAVPGVSSVHRAPPGDPEVVSAVAELARTKTRGPAKPAARRRTPRR